LPYAFAYLVYKTLVIFSAVAKDRLENTSLVHSSAVLRIKEISIHLLVNVDDGFVGVSKGPAGR